MTYQNYAKEVENAKIIKPENVDRIGKERMTNIEDNEDSDMNRLSSGRNLVVIEIEPSKISI